jgi:hypothetical protein
MHDAGGEREALLPPTRQRAGDLAPPRMQAEFVERPRDDLAPIGKVVEPRDEEEVLFDRQILVEREFLRHVADFALDPRAVAAHVEAEHCPLAGVGRQQAADHTDRRGLAGAVRAKETDDLARCDAQVDVVDGDDPVERLGETGDVDDVHGRLCGRSMSTIWPGCNRSATSWTGRASTR